MTNEQEERLVEAAESIAGNTMAIAESLDFIVANMKKQASDAKVAERERSESTDMLLAMVARGLPEVIEKLAEREERRRKRNEDNA